MRFNVCKKELITFDFKQNSLDFFVENKRKCYKTSDDLTYLLTTKPTTYPLTQDVSKTSFRHSHNVQKTSQRNIKDVFCQQHSQ